MHPGTFIHRRFGNNSPEFSLAKGGVTIYYEVDKEPNSTIYTVKYSVARCSLQDTFCKKIGRKIAKGRFDHGRDVFTYTIDSGIKDDAWKEVKILLNRYFDAISNQELRNIEVINESKIQTLVAIYERNLRG